MKKVCETCKHFIRLRDIFIMECLNSENLTQEEYDRCLGDNGEDCTGWTKKE